MDISTIIGIVAGFGLVIVAILLGGGLAWFINFPSMMIVVGGTIGATLINYPLSDVLKIFGVVRNVLFHSLSSPSDIIARMVNYAQITRRDGILALQNESDNIDDPFLSKSLSLAIDGLEPEVITNIMETEIEFIEERHRLGAEIFSTMGAFSPAMGMLGTLIGLVQMLMQMDDPKKIGPAMAVALLTTFYGVILANLIFLPVAGKLKTRSQQEILIKQLIGEGIRSIQAGDNPRVVESKLHAFIPPAERKSAFNK